MAHVHTFPSFISEKPAKRKKGQPPVAGPSGDGGALQPETLQKMLGRRADDLTDRELKMWIPRVVGRLQQPMNLKRGMIFRIHFSPSPIVDNVFCCGPGI